MKTKPALASIAAVTLLFTAACSDDSEDKNDNGSEGSEETEETTDDGGSDFAELSADEIMEQAQEDTQSLDSVRYGGGTVEDGQEIKMDISVTEDTCSGWMQVEGFRMEVLIVDGESWFRGDDAFWEQAAGTQAGAIQSVVGDKWIVDAEGEISGESEELCDLETFFGGDDGEETYTKVEDGITEVDGREAIKIQSEDEDGIGVAYVSVEAPHYLLRADRADAAGVMTFTEFNEVEPAEAPADDEQVDLDDL